MRNWIKLIKIVTSTNFNTPVDPDIITTCVYILRFYNNNYF